MHIFSSTVPRDVVVFEKPAFHPPLLQEQNDDGTITTKPDEGSPSVVIMTVLALLSLFAFHCTWITSSAYSSPSIVLATNGPGGYVILSRDLT